MPIFLIDSAQHECLAYLRSKTFVSCSQAVKQGAVAGSGALRATNPTLHTLSHKHEQEGERLLGGGAEAAAMG